MCTVYISIYGALLTHQTPDSHNIRTRFGTKPIKRGEKLWLPI